MSGEGFDQVSAWVRLDIAADDAISKNAAAQAPGHMAHVSGCAFHHSAAHGEDVRRLQAFDGHAADPGEDMPIQARFRIDRMVRLPAWLFLFQPFQPDFLERAAGPDLSTPALHGRVLAIADDLAMLVGFVARFQQGDLRVGAQADALLDAVDLVFETPHLVPAGGDFQVHAATVEVFLRLAFRFDGSDLLVS